jgi:maltose phosphorylase
MMNAQVEAWSNIWEMADIQIAGDDEAQQAIRFNIFHLNQTYTGEDSRLNIGPKGFTGEKYGGSTYWDSEAYCIPFYMSTKNQQVARQLLVYRHNQLGKAIENAEKLGFTNGAALYPMVTMNGEECHNEWEITFEEIHRNGAIAYAIHNYIRYTGDQSYLAEYGIDVLTGIARFWAQRVHWSEAKGMYVMHGVTGPNEYENNVNNNWYTSYIARWCMQYAMEALAYVKQHDAQAYATKTKALKFDEAAELNQWQHIIDNLYLGAKEGSRIFLQQDGFLDKELRSASSLDKAVRPINQHWSWDRILRSCFIKQADVLQGIYFFEEDFDMETIRENFDYYEPMTVHESSLSPCVHSILAAKLGYEEKAYEMYMRTSRLDLDDYNHEAHEGLHITSMAGTWMSIVQGFGGMRVVNGELTFNPMLPKQWKGFSFKVMFRGEVKTLEVGSRD